MYGIYYRESFIVRINFLVTERCLFLRWGGGRDEERYVYKKREGGKEGGRKGGKEEGREGGREGVKDHPKRLVGYLIYLT